MRTDSLAGRDRMIAEARHDKFKERGKLPQETACRACGALFAKGRWTWNAPKGATRKATCPACRRTSENNPAGQVELRGAFFAGHSADILRLVRNTEEREKTRHPMERIIAIAKDTDRATVTTTGGHMARRIGAAVARSYKGKLKMQYPKAELNVRVFWER